MTNKNAILILIAVVLVAATLADAGCIGAIRNVVAPETPTLTPTPLPATPTPTSTVTATPIPTPMPSATHVDQIYTLPLEAGVNQTSAIHAIYGNITYNGDPANGYEVLVDTINGSEYGNKTDAKGLFSVTFRDDWSPTYVVKIMDNLNRLIYTDEVPRFINKTGLISVRIDAPSTNVITVSITP